MEPLEQIFSALEELCDSRIIWKYTKGRADEFILPARYYRHCHGFCRAVKESVRLREKCVDNDTVHIARVAEEKKVPFIHTCHAGVSELVIPRFDDCGHCTELILLGIFRMGNEEETYPEFVEKLRNLPLYNARKMEAAAQLLSGLSVLLTEERKKHVLEHFIETICDIRVADSVAFIEKHYREPLTVSMLARRTLLSPSRLIHLFRQELGMTFSEYLLNCRLRNAKRYLTDSSFPLWKVMECCGFNSQSYFGIQFKKHTGFSPGVYRKRFRSSNHEADEE